MSNKYKESLDEFTNEELDDDETFTLIHSHVILKNANMFY